MNGQRANRWWLGAALVPAAILVVLRGLRLTGLLAGTPLGHWSGRLALVVLGLALYGAVYLLLRLAYRRRP